MSSNKKLEAAERALVQAQNRVTKLRATERTAERKRSTRRKVLVGAMYLKHAERNDQGMTQLRHALDGYLTRDVDRALFDLPPLGQRDL